MRYFNQEMETLSRSQLENLQSERLKKVVKSVYENVPLYRAKMDNKRIKPSDIKSIKDLVELPFTEKTDLRDSYPFGMFARPKKDIVRIHASSGTTGKMTVVGYTNSDIAVWSEVMARAFVSAGATDESTVHVAYGYGMFTGGLGAHYGAEKLGASVVPVSSGNTARQITLLKDFGTDVICCTPSYAAYLADEILAKHKDMSQFNLKCGIFGAEPWSEEMRKAIEQKLNIKAYDVYGLSEIIGPGVSIECAEQNGMHVWEDHFVPEILDDNMEPVADGEKGELVFTTITKEGLPLIRYRTRDLCYLHKGDCKCGRTHKRMGKILGRTDDMLIIRGVNVFPSQIEAVLLSLGNTSTNYQIVVGRVNNTDTLEIKIELGEQMFSDQVKVIENQRELIEHNINNTLGITAKVKLVEPYSLPRSEGKAIRVIDNRSK